MALRARLALLTLAILAATLPASANAVTIGSVTTVETPNICETVPSAYFIAQATSSGPS